MRRGIVVFALLASFLVVAVAPIGAATWSVSSHTNEAVGAIHTTDTDFQDGTLSNVAISGTGATASVVYTDSNETIDDFEDNDLSEWNPDLSDSSSSDFRVVSSPTYQGQYALQMRTDGNWENMSSFSGLSNYPSAGDNFSARFNLSDGGRRLTFQWALQSDGGGYQIIVHPKDNEFKIGETSSWDPNAGTVHNSSSPSIPADEWASIRVNWSTTGQITATLYNESGTELSTLTATDKTYTSGGIELWFSGGGGGKVWIDEIKTIANQRAGQYISANHSVGSASTVWANLTLTNTTATVRAEYWTGSQWQAAATTTETTTGNYTLDVSGQSATEWRVNVTFDENGAGARGELHDEGVLFTNHAPVADNATASPNQTTVNDEDVQLSIDVSDSEFGTPQGESVDVEFYVDGTSIGTQTLSSNGTATATATGLANGSHTWHVELSDDYGGTGTSETSTFTVRHYDPRFNNSTADPPEDGGVQTRSPTFSINLSDRDFAESSGDSVTATLYVDGSSVGSTTATSNGTISLSTTLSTGGNHTYHWEATDEYGRTSRSQTYNISVPSSLEIRNESAPTKLVDTVEVELRFYFDQDNPLIVNRSTTNGTINMTGLPVDRPFIVVARADGYIERRIFVGSLYETQRIYLLPENKTNVDMTFELRDYSGEFPKEDSVLVVQRALNGSWATVAGDYFGATGQFPVQLRYNYRHRLTIRNIATGEEKKLGSFTPQSGGKYVVEISSGGEIEVEETAAVVSFDPGTRRVSARNATTINVSIENKSAALSNYTVRYIYQNSTNLSDETVLATVSGTNATGETLGTSINLSGRAGGQVRVEVTYSTSGTQLTKRTTYEVQEYLPNQYSLIGSVQGFQAHVPAGNWFEFRVMSSLFTVVLITVIVSQHVRMSTELTGGVAIVSMIGFAELRWMPYTVVLVCGGAWIAFAALRRGL